MDKESNLNKKYLNYNYEDEQEEKINEEHVYFTNTYIYGWGKNKYGELGLGNTENVSIPK
jgi:alpha-tubulin suppressor-like RCC1 family protein